MPGYFDGDGAGAASGNVWRTRFTPDEPGQWSYSASFRTGANVAVDLSPNAGSATSFNGAGGNLTIAQRDANAAGFLKYGRLEYQETGPASAQHYLKFRDGPYWIKGDIDSPENFLAYAGFDATPIKHQYATHRNDWNNGDPNWTTLNGSAGNVQDGRNIIGALNYLSSRHVNSIYFLPMNIGGDGKDTWPFAGTINANGSSGNDNTRYDLSKLRQWETVFQHAQEKGIRLQVVLNEAETPNKQELDNATIGVERKLFYREMIARFGHHNALQWNLSEEYNRTAGGPGELAPSMLRSWAHYIQETDPYDHPITVHNGNYGNWPAGTAYPSEHPAVVFNGQTITGQRAEQDPFLGDSRFSVISYQNYNEADYSAHIEYFRARTQALGRPVPVMIDEPESLDALSADAVRKSMTWDIYLSGGAVEWFVRNSDQSLENFRTYEQVWNETWYARKFLEENLPFWEMNPDDSLIRNEDLDFGGAEVFAKPGEVYALYFPDASNDAASGPTELNLTGVSGDFILRWYNPRTGVFAPDSYDVILTGGGWTSVGASPDGFANTNDWAALVTQVPEPTSAAAAAVVAALLLSARRRR